MQQKYTMIGLASATLAALFLMGCTQPASSSSEATSTAFTSLPNEPISSLSEDTTTNSSTSSSSSSALQPTPAATEPEPLQLQDFLVCIDGRAVLNPADVTFWTFSFAHNAEINRLDPLEISTIRNLSLNDSVQKIADLYRDVPLEIYEADSSNHPVPFDDYEAYLNSTLATETHEAIFSLYVIDDEIVYTPHLVQQALEENRYYQAHTILRHDLTVQIQDDHIVDILFSVNDMSPFSSAHIDGQQFVQENQYSVGVYSLVVGSTGLSLPVGVQNHLDEPVLVRCNYTLVNGKATRNPASFELSLAAGAYGEQTLLILNEDIHPAGVESVESIGILLQFYSGNGQLLFESEGIEFPAYSNLDRLP